MVQIGYVGSQGHRLLATHDINPSNPQTCLDIISIANANPANVSSYQSPGATCGPTAEDAQWSVTVPDWFPVPHAQRQRRYRHRPNPQPRWAAPIFFAELQFDVPAFTVSTGCPVDGTPVFTDIFAEDTIANSNYNALEMMLQKRFSRGLQFQAAYTFSKSIDDGSTFEETLDPFNYRASRGLSLFNSKQRFVVSYDWELPVRRYSGFAGRLLDDWEVSGITQFQSGFPIRLNTEDDTELINSLFFLGTEAPSLVAPFQKFGNHQRLNGGTVQPNDFQLTNPGAPVPPLGSFNNGTQRTICCGPGLIDWDFSVHKKIALSETKYVQFRAEIFNVFNHTNYSNPDGGFSDGASAFGLITSAGDPRLLQFALKFFF